MRNGSRPCGKLWLGLGVLLVLLDCAVGQQPRNDQSERPRWQVYCLEAGGALGGAASCVGCMGGGLLLIYTALLGELFEFLGDTSFAAFEELEPLGRGIIGVSAALLPAMSGYGAYFAGNALGEGGTAGGAIAGAYIGLPVAVGLGFLGAYTANHAGSGWGIPFYVLATSAVPVGAVVGYNLSRSTGDGANYYNGRLGLPTLAVQQERLPDNSSRTVYDMKIVTVRF